MIIALLASLCSAGDNAELEFEGFSADGRYLSFVQYGVQDGSGFPWAQRVFLDAPANDWKGAPAKLVIEDEGASAADALAKVRKDSAGRARTLDIERDIFGTELVLMALKDELRGSTVVQVRAFEVGERSFQLTLEQIPTGNGEAHAPEVKQALRVREVGGLPGVDLQRDKGLPKSRRGATGYRIEKAWLYGGTQLVVFVSVELPGFEGTNRRFMAITGKLPSTPLEDDPLVREVKTTWGLVDAGSFTDTRCSRPVGDDRMWGQWHRDVACGRSAQVQTLALVPEDHREDGTWVFWLDRIDFPTVAEATAAKTQVMSYLPDPTGTDQQAAPNFAWCWHTVGFAKQSLYVVRTACHGNERLHNNVSAQLLKAVAVPTADGVYGGRGYHSGWGHAVKELPP